MKQLIDTLRGFGLTFRALKSERVESAEDQDGNIVASQQPVVNYLAIEMSKEEFKNMCAVLSEEAADYVIAHYNLNGHQQGVTITRKMHKV